MCLGIPGKIVEITDAEGRLGMVEVGGVRRQVDLTCVLGPEGPEGLIGEWALVHVGFAMSRIDADEAARTLEALAALGEAEEEMEAMRETEKMLSGERATEAASAEAGQ